MKLEVLVTATRNMQYTQDAALEKDFMSRKVKKLTKRTSLNKQQTNKQSSVEAKNNQPSREEANKAGT